ncbi:hypothetical protein B0J14DRAFT_706615 [Halenospora varia]|nr:hypothetical protein B0J14DRAFT_706615 [Halenospora varia]
MYIIAPLAENVGLRASPTTVAAIGGYIGTIKAIDPSTADNLTSLDIAYINCDPNIDVSNINPTEVILNAAMVQPKAIVLYSLTEANCNLTGYLYTTIYSMISASDSASFLKTIQSATQLQANIDANSTVSNSSESGITANNSDDGGTGPVKAAATSILSIFAGIIALLFLMIMAISVVRTHRHPERYGPRNGFPGRARQSRAKGLARAILEILPIVKFGDPERAKPESRDVELEDGNTSVHPREIVSAPITSTPISPSKSPPSGMGLIMQAESMHSQDAAGANEGELGCSICTEDFTTGADVRVLPCQHKYHPACIDPWLLNVSGTCPLCRHDLRPVTSATFDTANTPASGGELSPP